MVTHSALHGWATERKLGTGATKKNPSPRWAYLASAQPGCPEGDSHYCCDQDKRKKNTTQRLLVAAAKKFMLIVIQRINTWCSELIQGLKINYAANFLVNPSTTFPASFFSGKLLRKQQLRIAGITASTWNLDWVAEWAGRRTQWQ